MWVGDWSETRPMLFLFSSYYGFSPFVCLRTTVPLQLTRAPYWFHPTVHGHRGAETWQLTPKLVLFKYNLGEQVELLKRKVLLDTYYPPFIVICLKVYTFWVCFFCFNEIIIIIFSLLGGCTAHKFSTYNACTLKAVNLNRDLHKDTVTSLF